MVTSDLSDEALAELAGVSIPSVRRWRLGLTQPHPVLLGLIEKKLQELGRVAQPGSCYGLQNRRSSVRIFNPEQVAERR